MFGWLVGDDCISCRKELRIYMYIYIYTYIYSSCTASGKTRLHILVRNATYLVCTFSGYKKSSHPSFASVVDLYDVIVPIVPIIRIYASRLHPRPAVKVWRLFLPSFRRCFFPSLSFRGVKLRRTSRIHFLLFSKLCGCFPFCLSSCGGLALETFFFQCRLFLHLFSNRFFFLSSLSFLKVLLNFPVVPMTSNSCLSSRGCLLLCHMLAGCPLPASDVRSPPVLGDVLAASSCPCCIHAAFSFHVDVLRAPLDVPSVSPPHLAWR